MENEILLIAKKLQKTLKDAKPTQELVSLLSSNSSKTISLKMKLLATLFSNNGISSPGQLLEERRLEKKRQSALSFQAQLDNSTEFIKVFEQEIVLQGMKLGIKISQEKVFQSQGIIKLVKFLLDKITCQKSNETLHESSHFKDQSAEISRGKLDLLKAKVIDDVSPHSDKIIKVGELERKLRDLELELGKVKNDYQILQQKHALTENLYKESCEFSKPIDLQKNRVFILKSQNIQLSRYLNDIRTELLSKEGFVHEVDEDLYKIRDILTRCVGLISSGKAEVIANGISELKLCSQYLEALQRQIHRRIKDHTRDSRIEDRTPDFEFMSEFISTPKHPEKVSLIDICSGKIDHLNLKHVSRLECQLNTLYECLLTLRNSIDVCLLPNVHPQISDHQMKIIEQAQKELYMSISTLSSLSVLVPAAPYPKLEVIRSLCHPTLPSKAELTSKLPPCSAPVKAKIGDFWEQMLHGLNALINQKNLEVETISKELEFHKTLYKQYNEKIVKVVDGLEKKRDGLNSDLSGVIGPLEAIREKIANLEFNPVKVGDFLAYTDSILENLVLDLKKKNL